MWSQSDFRLPTENRFITDRVEEMTRDGYQMAGKRRRQNTGQSTGQSDNDQQRSVFLLSNGDDKLNIIFDEIVNIRISQEKTHQGMLFFQNSLRCMDENIHNNIQATNRNTDILKTLAYKSIDQEARSRRNNLIFWGLAENLREDCFVLIRDFIQNQLDLDPDRIYLARAHRLGVKKPNLRGQRRPIIVNFRDFRDTEVIMSRAYMLRNTRFSIDYDLPKEIGDARKRLWSESKQIRLDDPRAKTQIVYPAKLLVDGKLVRDEFPDWNVALRGNRVGDFSHVSYMENICTDNIVTQSNRHTTQHSTYEPPQDVLRLSKSPVTQSNRVWGKEPSDGCLDQEEPMTIQSGVETFMQSMSAEESQNDATKKDNRRENSPSIFRPYVASSNESPIREQSEPTNTQQGYTVLNNQSGSSTTSNQTQSDKSNQNNNNKQQERVSRSLIRGVRRPHSVSVSRGHVNNNRPTSQSKQENPPAKNSQQPINGTNQNSGSREQANGETPEPNRNNDPNTQA